MDVLVEHPPQGDRAEGGGHRAIGGLRAAAIPGPARLDLAGQVLAVVRLEVIEGPFDDDPTEFAERLLQAGLEAMAGLGRRIGPAERDDEANDLGDHRDQAGGQREQGGGEVRCREETAGRSMVHRGGLSCCRTELVRHCHFTGKAPQPSSGPLPEAADSSRVMDENQTKRAETHGTGAIAPGRRDHPDRPYDDPRVSVHIDDGRSFVRRTTRSYDLVSYAVVDSLVLHSGYSSLRLESYLFTEEAFRDIASKLNPDGVFVMYNLYRQGWIIGRLEQMVEKVFGQKPLVIALPYTDAITPGQAMNGGGYTFLIAGRPGSKGLEAVRAKFDKDSAFWLSKRSLDN